MSRYAGPTIKPETVTDAAGKKFTVWPGMVCLSPGCGVGLTSRNRYQHRRLCIVHGRAEDAARRAPTRASRVKAKAADSTSLALPEPIRVALSMWLQKPGWLLAEEMLRQALDDEELRFLIQKAIPPSQEQQQAPAPSPSPMPPTIGPIPTDEDDYFSLNPMHKTKDTTEFLADCDHYGVR